MYEYHCWAVLPDFGDREAERRLGDELRARIAGLDDGARESFNVTNLNTLLVTASGLRNHGQPLLLGVFEWITEAWPGSYGVMFLRSEYPDPDGNARFEVRKLGGGRIESLADHPFLDL
jgi:hypothetical protein